MQRKESGMRFAAIIGLLCAWSGMVGAEETKLFKDVDVKAAKKLYEQGVYLLDVRTGPEYEAGHLPGAQLIPVQELEKRLKEVKAKKDAKILVYCRSGARSIVASEILVKSGYTKISNMLGGFNAWSAATYPSEKGKPKKAEEVTEEKTSATETQDEE
jgi:rhodanese-related sulfurtransferase